MPWQMQLLFASLLAFGIGAAVGVVFRRHAILAFGVTFAVVLCVHLVGDYVRSGFPAITLHGIAVSLYIPRWPLLLFAFLPALGGTLFTLVGCRLISRRQRKPAGVAT
jgi:hypothetical protein